MQSNKRKKILVLRYRFIGDTILTVPFLRNLRAAEPDAFIAWVVAPGSAEVIRGIPYVDELIYWDPKTIHADSRGTHRTFAAKLDFIRTLRQTGYDKVYVLKRSLSSAIMALLTGARERIGFNTEGRGLLLTRRVVYNNDQHEVENFLDVLRADGIAVKDDHLEAWLTDEERAFADSFYQKSGVKPGDRIIGIHPFAANPIRAWQLDNFIAVAQRLQVLYGARILIFGGSRDAWNMPVIREALAPHLLEAVGTTTLRQSMALLSRCDLLLCNDSGIMHLAASLQVPIVALFGPQSPRKFGPWGNKSRFVYNAFACSPCKQKFFTECEPSLNRKPACIEAITVDEVTAACCRLLEDANSGYKEQLT